MIYLDNAALERPKQECIDVAIDVMKNHWGNASSTYEFGIESKRIVEHTRELIAKEINCDPEEIIFCGSGSEANALAIDGYYNYNLPVITSRIEHPSILENNNTISEVRCFNDGTFDYNDLEFCEEFVSLQFANSEIGTIQDIKRITEILHKKYCIVHTDATQAFGRIPINLKDLNVDMMTATSQKIGGILGAAFLYVKKGIHLSSIIHGHQEQGLRGGTYNVPAIAAFGKAIELINYDKQKEIANLRDKLLFQIYKSCNKTRIANVYLNGNPKYRLPNNLSFTFEGIDANALMSMLDLKGIVVSLGSACNSGIKTPSKVLTAIGLSPDECASTIRVTLGEDTTIEECDEFVKQLCNCIKMIKTS